MLEKKGSYSMPSIWKKERKKIPDTNVIPGQNADVIIVGAGLAGILTAWLLKEKGIRPLVLEAETIGSGQTGNTTAKVTSQHGLIYDRLIRSVGLSRALQYAQANEWAVGNYARLIKERGIDCDWRQTEACLYTIRDEHSLEREEKAACKLGLSVELKGKTELPFPVKAALFQKDQGQFMPLAFLDSLAEEVPVLQHTAVTNVEAGTVYTSRGNFTAEHIVMADHFPFRNHPGYYFLRMHQERSYVVAFAQAQQMNNMYLGIDREGLSFRSYRDMILLGGGGHRTGVAPAQNPYELLRARARDFWPNAAECAHWSAQDGKTLDGIPYIGRFSSRFSNQYVATGFGKWGMTNSMVAARLIADAIAGEANPWKDAFSPQRFTPKASVGPFLSQTALSVKNIALRLFYMPQEAAEQIKKGEGAIVMYHGQKAGVYKDETGKLFAVSVKCPHLGCRLQWNQAERSWDCPCHGSRFDHTGKKIDNPAQTDLISPCTCPADD